jgi:hypothetical protein
MTSNPRRYPHRDQPTERRVLRVEVRRKNQESSAGPPQVWHCATRAIHVRHVEGDGWGTSVRIVVVHG